MQSLVHQDDDILSQLLYFSSNINNHTLTRPFINSIITAIASNSPHLSSATDKLDDHSIRDARTKQKGCGQQGRGSIQTDLQAALLLLLARLILQLLGLAEPPLCLPPVPLQRVGDGDEVPVAILTPQRPQRQLVCPSRHHRVVRPHRRVPSLDRLVSSGAQDDDRAGGRRDGRGEGAQLVHVGSAGIGHSEAAEVKTFRVEAEEDVPDEAAADRIWLEHGNNVFLGGSLLLVRLIRKRRGRAAEQEERRGGGRDLFICS
eukprot:753201-Hanusia_phi.AAC.8